MRKRKVGTTDWETDWTPTFGIAIAALTTYLVYLSTKVDKLIQNQSSQKGAQEKADEEAAKDREDLRLQQEAQKTKSDTRARRITTALTVIGILVAVLSISKIANSL